MFLFSLQFLFETIYTGANIKRDMLGVCTEINVDFHVNVSYFHSTLTKSRLCREILVILPNIRFHRNSGSTSRYLAYGQTDITKLIEALLQISVAKTQKIKNIYNLYCDGWLGFFHSDYKQLRIYLI